jgi:murein tripeptide amidase MpaA
MYDQAAVVEARRLTVTAAFPGGSIEVISADDPGDIRVALAPDAISGHRHWFFFRLTGAKGRDCRIAIVNNNTSFRLPSHDAVPDAWTGYEPFATYDLDSWFRVGAENVGGCFAIRHRPERDSVYYAHFPPYPVERHHRLVARALRDSAVGLDVLGVTPDGSTLDLLMIGTSRPGMRSVWITAQQHPAEPMGGWFVEGLLDRLLDPLDSLAQRLRQAAVFYVVPTMNPDGVRRAHSRVNARGADLNRAWLKPDLENAPEVAWVRERMARTGVDFFLDVHGDEQLGYNFLGGSLEIPSRSERLRGLFFRFAKALGRANPDYRLGPRYPGGAPDPANLQQGWNWVGEEFKCLALLLEQPFKDNDETRIKGLGWSPERSMRLGRSTLDALADVLPILR